MATYVDLPVKDRIRAFTLSQDMADVYFSVEFDDIKVSRTVVACSECFRSGFLHTDLC